ncbi:zinc-ribbon domain-containing protein, partial [Roseisolibacter sp. H3M3-2]|uniref:zinc-ribbon domain-containing protein n=1 Tax=Roseisolibacter sp. H3M3-2 TaxID=3031323 RepID=UPI0023D9D238
MNVTCPDCRSVFRVDPAKVPPAGVRARCSVCGGIFAVSGEGARAAERRATPADPVVAQPAPQAPTPP